ncbi:tRNA (adenosine(37)-N6)-threonylcarbamoyltransferase complex ATPase subunit type 1 TsaE [Alloscardovia venturai]|uniref:tRNA threonylcarbamoyladenosine biosynthesis protein TsaE n=1 Tax=Alloscardovia venturai TaxID=1769421 RepID=A0ABW2Y3H9_9BIFI
MNFCVSINVPTAQQMHELGRRVAQLLQGGDVVTLSGPLGAGKTTFAQGVGEGLKIGEPIVSPTFTIARELDGLFADGQHAHMVHVDAYRVPGSDNDDAMAGLTDEQKTRRAINRLLDELESLGLDEILEDPDDSTVILIEWGAMMASVLSPDRLDISIDRSIESDTTMNADELTSDGARTVILTAHSDSWIERLNTLEK